ncbi:hypothetical protein C8R48DRAFT_768761 [Suillus tomentosus]|nr:hypothetical protein C8R48DRAFT_768761 [Suillus tomentosus]
MAPNVDDSQHPRCSGHPGAGKGGRNAQLERLDAILDAPARASQPKGSNSFDSTVPVNPVTPEPPRKGRGTEKQPPPPYHISEQPIPNATTPNATIPNTKIPRAWPKAKAIVPPPPSIETVKSQPAFIQCEDGGQFGFSLPIVPPGMEPDLQALNNSFVAAAKAKRVVETTILLGTNDAPNCIYNVEGRALPSLLCLR